MTPPAYCPVCGARTVDTEGWLAHLLASHAEDVTQLEPALDAAVYYRGLLTREAGPWI